MMLSPQAARMGCVSTKGHIRRSTRFLSIGRGRRHFEPSSGSRFRLSTETSRAFFSGLSRFKSTMAAYDEGEDDNIDYRHQGHVAAAKARASDATKSYDEDWMINLGRDGDNEWLTGPRDQEWFTGVAPRDCPGTYDTCPLYGMILVSRIGCLVGDSGMQLIYFIFHFFLEGADKEGTIRSLALPNLSAVTREAAKEYFDNSWTLYETLFAGLKGEEGFYR
jgi:hypothetical protein